jgi:uncharacterized lipoprotein YmbA
MLVTAVAGCRSVTPPVTYYTLSPVSSPAIQGPPGERPDMIIGIRSVDLPGYVNRTQIVTRKGPNQLEISSLHRWADYPDRMVQQMLGENLQVLMPDARVANAPWPIGLKPDVTVTFKFLELIGTPDDQVRLSAEWTIDTDDVASAARLYRMNTSEPMTGSGFDELVAAHSRALAALCKKVADSLSAMRD